jgi:YggT family protein
MPLSMLIELAFDAVVTLFVLRLLAEACRADFNNPLSQFVYRYTNPVLAPMRKVLPNWRRINLAPCCWPGWRCCSNAWLLFAAARDDAALRRPAGAGLAETARLCPAVLLVLIFGWSLMSMLAVDRRHPLLRLAGTIVEVGLDCWDARCS